MKNIILLASIFFFFQLMGFHSAFAEDNHRPILLKKIAQIQDPQITSEGHKKSLKTLFLLNVPNNGCTNSTHYKLDLQNEEFVVKIKLIKIKNDHCKGFFPEGVDVILTSDQIEEDKEIDFINTNIIDERYLYEDLSINEDSI